MVTTDYDCNGAVGGEDDGGTASSEATGRPKLLQADKSLPPPPEASVWKCLVWCGLVWSILVWYRLVWSSLVWYPLVWYGLV